MTKILITGVGGYIGSIAAYLFLQKGYEIIGIDNFQTGYHDPVNLLKNKFPDGFRFYEADLKEDLSPIFNKEKDIVAVVHYAASCVVDESMNNPYKYFYNNPLSTLNLMEAISKYNIKKIVFSSTCAVYGEAKYVPIDEKHPTLPNNVYGESKFQAENIIRWYQQLKGLNFIIFRYFNVSGGSDDSVFGYSKVPSTHLTENAVKGALGINDFFLTYQESDTPDKSPIRDYINVVDLNIAHIKAVEYLLGQGKSETINLGTGTGNSVLEIVEKVEKFTGVALEKKKDNNLRMGEASKLVATIDKAKQVLGWTPSRKIEDSIKSLVGWYKKHPHGWEK